MSSLIRNQLDEVFAIAKGDGEYAKSVSRVRNELEKVLRKKGNKAKVLLTYGELEQPVGFGVLVDSASKMGRWQMVFLEEGWVEEDFEIEAGALELLYLYVQPEYRRLGRASGLLGEMLEWAWGRDVPAVYAYVSDRRNVALDFYVANGAEVVCEFEDDEVVMRGNGEKPLVTAFVKWKRRDLDGGVKEEIGSDMGKKSEDDEVFGF